MEEALEVQRGKALAKDLVRNYLEFREAAWDDESQDLLREKKKALLAGIFARDSEVEGLVSGLMFAIGEFVDMLCDLGVPNKKISFAVQPTHLTAVRDT